MSDPLGDPNLDRVSVSELRVNRLPGIRGSYTLADLSPGINIIHGPNSVGKSRTATAIASLFWPSTIAANTEVIGLVRHGDNVWTIEIDSAETRYRRNDDSSPRSLDFAIPSDTNADRYLLTLQDLLRIDNRSYAEEILREAAGGFDLESMAKGLGATATTDRITRPRTAALIADVRTKLKQQRNEIRQLEDQERSIVGLRAQHDQAKSATKQIELLRAAQEFQRHRKELADAQERLERFPKVLSDLKGTEYDEAVRLQEALEQRKQEHDQLAREINSYKEQLQVFGFEDSVPSRGPLKLIAERIRDLRNIEGNIEDIATRVSRTKVDLSTQSERLAPSLSELQIRTLDEEGLRKLAKIERTWRETQNKLNAQEEISDWLGRPEAWNRDILRQGLDLLLRHQRKASLVDFSDELITSRKVILSVGVLIVLAAMMIGWFGVPYAYLVCGLAVPLFYLAFVRMKPGNRGELESIESEYAHLQLELPQSWNEQDVSQLIQQVQGDLGKADLEFEREMRWKGLESRRDETARLTEQLASERADLSTQLGYEIGEDIPEEIDRLSIALGNWRRGVEQLRDSEAELDSASTHGAMLKEEILAKIAEFYEVVEPSNADGLQRKCEEIDERLEKSSNILRALQNAELKLTSDINPQIGTMSEDLSRIYTAANLELGDHASLKTLCETIEFFRNEQGNIVVLQAKLDAVRSRLDTDAGYEDLWPQALEERITAESQLAERRDLLSKEIAQIEMRVGRAESDTVIEELITRERDLLREMKDELDRAGIQEARRIIVNFVRDQDRISSQIPVFRRARDLFTDFTNGEYQLELDSSGAEFSARDSGSGFTYALDKLSSGTRVQLLLAVRIAFNELSEHNAKLPIMLDEVLGNSDDLRARVIISAMFKIAAQGRQVLYFTAQQDEVQKWRSFLENTDETIPWKTIDLGDIRGSVQSDPINVPQWDDTLFDRYIVPEGTPYGELSDILQVPRLDLLETEVDGIDLWYFIDDTNELVRLRNRGVKTWGQYNNLYGLHPSTFPNQPRAKALAKAAQSFLVAWAQGRPRKVSKATLRESGAISDLFWDQVVECAERNDWDGARLIVALENKAVSGFRANKAADLRSYLIENSHITEQTPSDDASIRTSTMISVYDELEDGILTDQDVDDLIKRMISRVA